MYKIKGADSNEYGPISADQVRQWIRENRLNRASLAENVDVPGWKALGEFAEFADAFPSSEPAYVTPSSVSASPGYSMPIADPVAAAARLKVPTILMIICAVLGLLITLANPFMKKLWIDGLLHVFEQANVQLPAESRTQMEAAATAGFQLQDAFGMALGLVVNSVILVGSFKLLKLQSWGLGLAAAILIMLPCGGCCCCIGLPIGIWLVILLSKPEVKSSFH
ncbi:MAG TPA: hypothetical protein VMB21_02775 [Candidatus Limnocylindria bacterium]|nr:hypothetical protein [Candidatus Limnocylindria bacterium]